MDGSAPIGSQPGTRIDQGNGGNVYGDHHDPNYIENYEDYYATVCNSLLDNGFVNSRGAYETLDGEDLERYHKQISAHNFLSVHLAALNENRQKISKMMFEAITGLTDNNGGKKSQAPSIVEQKLKMAQMDEQFFNQGVSTLMKQIYDHNKAELDAELAKADEDNTHWYDDIPYCGEGDEENKVKDAKAAVDRFNDAMKESYQSLAKAMANNGIGGLNADFDNRINNIVNQLNTGMFKPDGSGRYIDVNALRKDMINLRRQLPGIMNAQSLILMAEETGEEAKRLIFESHTGLNGPGSQIKAYQQKFSIDSNHISFLFNTQASNIIAIAKLTNQSRYLQRQLDKIQSAGYQVLRYLADTCKIVGVALVIIGLCTSWIGGLGLAIAAAGVAIVGALSTWGAQKIADSVKDEYKPSKETNADKDKRIQDIKRKKKEEQAEAAEDRIIGDIDSKYQGDIKDGYKAVDFAAIAGMYKQLTQVQNAMRIMLEARATGMKAQSLIFTAHTGLRGGSGAYSMLDTLIDNHTGQKNIEFQFASANQKEIVDAYNMEHAQKIQMENATTTMGWTIGIAIASAIVGGCIGGATAGAGAQATESAIGTGIGVGFALGSGIGGYIAENINNTAPGRGSYGATYTGSIGRFRNLARAYMYTSSQDQLVGNHKAGDKVSSKLDYLENQAAFNAVNAGAMDAGDGYMAVNTGAASKAIKTLGTIANVRALLIAAKETKHQIMNMIFTTYTGLPAIESSNVLSAINRANLDANVQVTSFLKQHIEEQVQVANRAREADKALETANVKLVATVVIAAATLGAGGAAAALCVPLVYLANTVIDIIQDTRSINSGKGEIGQPKDKVEAKRPRGANSLEQADEIQANMDFDASMLEDIGSGKIGINSGLLTAMENKSNGLAMVARLIATARKTVEEAKASSARANGCEAATTSDASEEIIANMETVIQQELSNKLQAMQNYIERNNQIADYKRDRVQKICMGVVEVAMVALAGVQASNQQEQQALAQQNNKAPLSMTEAKRMEDLGSSLKGLGIAYLSCALVSEFTGMISGAVYDSCQGSYHAKNQDSKGNGSQGSGKATNEGQVRSKQFALTEAQTQADESDAMADGKAGMDKEVAALDYRDNKEIGSSVFGGGKAFLQLLKGFKDNTNDENALMVQNSKDRAQLREQEEKTMEEIGAVSVALAKSYKDSVEKFHAAEKDYNAGKITHQQLLLAYADMIANCEQMELELTKLQTNVTALEEKNKKMKEARAEREKGAVDPFVNPESEHLPSMEEIKQNIENIRTQLRSVRAAQAKLQQAKTKEETQAALKEFNEADAKLQESLSKLPQTVESSQLMAEVRQNKVSIQEQQLIQEKMLKTASEVSKEITGKETLLEDIKDPDTLQKVYENMHAKIFVPAREARQASLFLKTLLTKRAKGEAISPEDLAKARASYPKLAPYLSEDDNKMLAPMLDNILSSSGPLTQEQTANLNIARGQVSNVEGKAKEAQTSFNRFCGVLRDHMKKISNGTRELTAVAAPAAASIPQAAIAPAPSAPAGRTTSAPSAAVNTQSSEPVVDVNDPLIQEIMKDLKLDGKKVDQLTEDDKIEIYKKLQEKIDTCERSCKTLRPALQNMQKTIMPDDATRAKLIKSIDVILGMNNVVTAEQKAVLVRVQESLKQGKMPEASDLKIVLGVVTSAEGKVQELKDKQKKIYDSLSDKSKKKIDGDKPVTASISQPVRYVEVGRSNTPVKTAGSVTPQRTDVPDDKLAQLAQENDNDVSGRLGMLGGNNRTLMNQADTLLDMARRGATVNA